MCRQDSRVHLSAEEELAAEESLSIYCKPVELYNILQRRAVGNVMQLIGNISTSFLHLCFVCNVFYFSFIGKIVWCTYNIFPRKFSMVWPL